MATDEQYRRPLTFRTAVRRFDHWSRAAAEEHGLTHTQHQLLLAVRGSLTEGGPTVGEVAEALLVQHHTVTGLVDRVQQLGLVERVRSQVDARRVQLRLTAQGLALLHQLTAVHVAELKELATALHAVAEA